MINILTKIGLTQKEAAVYLACLRLGTASISKISRAANLKRPTAYLAVKSLIQKNLISPCSFGKTPKYKALDPRLLEHKARQSQLELSKILPELITVYKATSQKPKIQFYEGEKQLLTLYEEIFCSQDIWLLVSAEKFLKAFSAERLLTLVSRLKNNNGFIHFLAENNSAAKQLTGILKEKSLKGIAEYKLLAENSFNLEVEIIVFKCSLAFISLHNQTATVIDDRDISSSIKQLFQSYWQLLS